MEWVWAAFAALYLLAGWAMADLLSIMDKLVNHRRKWHLGHTWMCLLLWPIFALWALLE